MSKFIKLTKLNIDLKPFETDIVLLKANKEKIETYKEKYREFASHIENYCIKTSTFMINVDEIQLFAKRTFFKHFYLEEITPPNNLNLGTFIQLKGINFANREHLQFLQFTVEESPEQILTLIQGE